MELIIQSVNFCFEKPLVILEWFVLVIIFIFLVIILQKILVNDLGIYDILISQSYLTYRMINWARLYKEYMEIVSIINSSDNLSFYQNKESHYMKLIKKFKVFKKSDFSVNSYYWKIKTKDCLYYYTTTDNDKFTLYNILRATKISEFRGKCINDFFEYCLVSYVTNEDQTLLESLSKGERVELGQGGLLCTQEYFEKNKLIVDATTEVHVDHALDSSYKTPDLYITCGNHSCIIDAYNGTNEKEILKKLQSYSECFPKSRVYVFCSGVSALEQLTSKNKSSFSFHFKEGGKLKTVDRIECGTVVLDLSAICNKYFSEYRIFRSDIFYWLNCEQAGTIMKSNIDSK